MIHIWRSRKTLLWTVIKIHCKKSFSSIIWTNNLGTNFDQILTPYPSSGQKWTLYTLFILCNVTLFRLSTDPKSPLFDHIVLNDTLFPKQNFFWKNCHHFVSLILNRKALHYDYLNYKCIQKTSKQQETSDKYGNTGCGVFKRGIQN